MAFELWLAFAMACVVLSISPGSGAVNTISNGMQFGLRRSVSSILGLQLGLALQILVVGVGLGAILASSNTAFSLIKWLGVAYLVWLGIQKWRQPVVTLKEQQSELQSASKRFWQAVFVNLTNPKSTVFLVALFPQFLNLAAPQWPQFLLMGATLVCVDTLVMMGYASLASQLARWMQSAEHQKWQNRLFGSLFIFAAALMAGFRSEQSHA